MHTYEKVFIFACIYIPLSDLLKSKSFELTEVLQLLDLACYCPFFLSLLLSLRHSNSVCTLLSHFFFFVSLCSVAAY